MALTTFTSGQVLTAAQMNALQANDYNQTVSTKTASYTLVAADKGTKIVMNSASATTITVNTSLFSAGDTLTILNISTGVCTVTAGTATVSTAGSLALAQNAGGTLYFTSPGVSVFQANGVAAASPGLNFISASSFSAVSSVSLATNTFSSTYRNYRIIFQTATTAATVITLRTRTSGSDNTDANYFQASAGLTAGGSANDVGQNNGTAITVFDLSTSGARNFSMAFDVISPLQNATTGTAFLGNLTGIIGGTGRVGRNFAAAYLGTPIVDSLSFISSVASDFTGVVRVYGYGES